MITGRYPSPSPVVRQATYQQKHRKAGLCFNCPQPVVVRWIVDPVTMTVIRTKRLSLCARHYRQQVAKDAKAIALYRGTTTTKGSHHGTAEDRG